MVERRYFELHVTTRIASDEERFAAVIARLNGKLADCGYYDDAPDREKDDSFMRAGRMLDELGTDARRVFAIRARVVYRLEPAGRVAAAAGE